MQHNKDVEHQGMKIYCATNQSTELQFLGPYNKPHGICALVKHNHMRFDPKIVHYTCAILSIPCACTSCTSILDQTWVKGLSAHQQPSIDPSNIAHNGI